MRKGHFLTLFLNLLICQVGMLTASTIWAYEDTLQCSALKTGMLSAIELFALF